MKNNSGKENFICRIFGHSFNGSIWKGFADKGHTVSYRMTQHCSRCNQDIHTHRIDEWGKID